MEEKNSDVYLITVYLTIGIVFAIGCIWVIATAADIIGLTLPVAFLILDIIITIFFVSNVLIVRRAQNNLNTTIENEHNIFEQKLLNRGFNIDKKIVSECSALFVDDKNKKWCVKTGRDNEVSIFQYSDLITFDLYEDGNTLVAGTSDTALLGALFFGVTGAIIGSSATKNTQNICNLLQIRITLNNLQKSEVILTLIDIPLTKNSELYRKILDIAKNIMSTLAYMQNQVVKIENK